MRYISTFKKRHEDILLRSFLLSLGQKKRDWATHFCSPKSISSHKGFIKEFLIKWGSRTQRFEGTYRDLLAALQVEGLLGLLEGDGLDIPDLQENLEDMIITAKSHDDIVANKDDLKSPFLTSKFGNGIGEQSVAVPNPKAEGLLNPLGNDSVLNLGGNHQGFPADTPRPDNRKLWMLVVLTVIFLRLVVTSKKTAQIQS